MNMESTRPPAALPTNDLPSNATRPMNLDRAGRMDFDLSCVQCGHNLRGLLPTGICGECGSLVELSMGSGPLAATSLGWIARVRWGIAAMTLLLPWLWLPLVWPVVWLACWHMTEADPSPGRRGEWVAVITRIVLVLLPVPICIWLGVALLEAWPLTMATHVPACLAVVAAFLLCALLAAERLSARVGARGIRRMVRLVGACWLFGPPAVALLGLGLGTLGGFGDGTLAIIVGLLGVFALAATLVLFPLALIGLWREFETAEVLAHSSPSRVKTWTAWATPLPAATPPADAAAGPPAGA